MTRTAQASLAFPIAAPGGWVARAGDAMRRYRRVILGIQWVVVVFYLALVTIPAFLPLPSSGATIFSSLTLFAQFMFWGIWWPFVMLSMMLVGRLWCGVFCPEGALTEYVSRRGLGRAIPRWLRWGGWPFVAFVSTTVFGQLVSVYEYPKAALLILGGSTLAALAVGFVYGKGKRVWCRYLCPANGVFALLAKVAPLHFRVNAEAWRSYPTRSPSVDCAPLIDLRHMQSASACHACGRCSGYRGAVQLAMRSPNREILSLAPGDASTGSALLLIFGLLGVALGAFQWTASPWFVQMKQAAAQWLVERESFGLLKDNAPWWLLTHYPEVNDVFTWLDGLCIVAYIGGVTLVVGGITWISLAAAAWVAGRLDWRLLSMALVPLAGIGVFLGLSMLTLNQLRAEGVTFSWIGQARAALLALGIGWSAWLGARMLFAWAANRVRALAATIFYALPLALAGSAWYLLFFSW